MAEKQPLRFTKNIITILDIIIALSIIIGSYKIINTSFGSISIVFGFVMLTITAILKILQKW